MIYVVDFRQEDHFKALFTVLKMLDYDFVEQLHHLKFGTVKFGTEIQATRMGNIILLEDVLKKTIEKADGLSVEYFDIVDDEELKPVAARCEMKKGKK